MKVAILGAGFSGLTLAWALQKRGVHVEVFESQARSGGLIQTSYQKVLVESAAHALLNNADVEELFGDLDLPMVAAGFVSNKKWIFRDGKPQNWPLTWKESLKSLGFPQKPSEFQSVRDWVVRNFSSPLDQYLVAPALQGIYGTQTDQLSAKLVLRNFFDKSTRSRRGKVKGSVAPLNGMGELISKLSQLVSVRYNSQETLENLKSRFDSVVVATGIHSAADLIQKENSILSMALRKVPMVSLTSATISLNKPSGRVQGFGCLFPKSENFESLGVLFNSDIFAKRGNQSETWILPGDQGADSAQIILNKILKDRKKMDPTDADVGFCEIHRWPYVLPLYGMELERVLAQEFGKEDVFLHGACVSKNVFLTGNYLGGIGLAKILGYNKRLAERILKDSK